MENGDLKDLIQNKDLSGIDAYIKNGGSVNVTYEHGMTPLFLAISLNSLYNDSANEGRNNVGTEIVLRLIEEGANVNSRRVNGITPLLVALNLQRSKEIIIELLNAGSDVNAENKIETVTPVLLAVRGNYDKEVIYKLLEMGAKVNHGWDDALKYALRRTDNIEITEMLLDAGANVEALHHTCVSDGLDCGFSCKEGKCRNKKIIDFLVSKGFNLKMRFKNVNNRTIIHEVRCNYLISLCIKSGVSIESKDKEGKTPLINVSSQPSSYDRVKSLLTLFNANPNNVDNELRSPLYYAIPCCLKVCKLLLFHGSDIFDDIYAYICQHRNWFPKSLLFVKYSLLFIDENNLYDNFKKESIEDVKEKSKFILSFSVGNCKKELSKMKCTYIKGNLTFYEFCQLKRFYKSKPVDMYLDELNYSIDQIRVMFRIYHDLIITRIKDNMIKNNEKHSLKSLEGIIIRPLPVENENDSQVVLNYDCSYLIARYLNREQLVTLFLASIED